MADNVLEADCPPITSKAELIDELAAGCKPRSEWRIGSEYEKFLFRTKDLRPIPYEGPDGVGTVLAELARRYSCAPVYEEGKLIALKCDNGSAISLEPGGQLELSGAPLPTLHEIRREKDEHLAQLREILGSLDLGMLSIGFLPKWRREDMCWMPKARYRIMRDYMTERGMLGQDMMTRTCTSQVNLDFADEADMVRKIRVAFAFQPVATAIFANSIFVEGKPSAWLSYRSHIWTDTDPDRCGSLSFIFEPGFGFERWVDYLLDVPMYFVRRGGRYIDAAGRSFRDFMNGALPEMPGERPHIGDWRDQVSIVFPEARLKRYIEMRGADAGSEDRILAVAAYWTGLFYDDQALEKSLDMIKDWTEADRIALQENAGRLGLGAPFRDGVIGDWARATIAIARGGLARRACRDEAGRDETQYLDGIMELVERGETDAERLARRFHGPWRNVVDPIYEECAL